MQLKTGTLLQGGKYKIIRSLGQGGFGITYEAEQVLLRRRIAVKEFFMKDCCERNDATSRVTVGMENQRALVERFRGKFMREAQMIAGMDHPHIVRVLDVFEENGTAYYVMDFLPGGSLADMVKKEGPLSEAKAEEYIRQVAYALDYIHRNNTVHLDVKPSNILLNAKGETVLIDFGISKHYDESGEQTSSTPVGISKGYAPLEQGRDGDVSQFKPSTDIYALGATLYHLVSGLVPPDASIVNEEGLICPLGIPEHLWTVIETAMRPKRKDRPQSISAFLSLLGRVTESNVAKEDETEVVSTSETQEMPVQRVKNHPSLKWSWVLLCTVFVLAVVLTIRIRKNSRHPEQAPRGFINDSIVMIATLKGYDNGHEWIDLGLPSGTKWATCNVGALNPCDYGHYYAWGETNMKSEYSWATLKYCSDGTGNHFTKYIPSGKSVYWSKNSCPDNKIELDISDDTACQIWSGKWSIPTKTQWQELVDKCIWSWNGDGYEVNGPNGQSIILPAAGCRIDNSSNDVGLSGRYWSSSLDTDYPSSAWYVRFSSGGSILDRSYRSRGYSIRPVTD